MNQFIQDLQKQAAEVASSDTGSPEALAVVLDAILEHLTKGYESLPAGSRLRELVVDGLYTSAAFRTLT